MRLTQGIFKQSTSIDTTPEEEEEEEEEEQEEEGYEKDMCSQNRKKNKT